MALHTRLGEVALRQRGFTLIAVMMALALLALTTQRVVFVLSQQSQRDREARLLLVGQAFVRAIGSYYETSPGSFKTFPSELAELVEDRRFLGIMRHLREVYEDPVVGEATWQVLRRADGRIEGVCSTSDESPIRSAGVDLGEVQLPAAARYSDWKFVYVPALAASGRK